MDRWQSDLVYTREEVRAMGLPALAALRVDAARRANPERNRSLFAFFLKYGAPNGDTPGGDTHGGGVYTGEPWHHDYTTTKEESMTLTQGQFNLAGDIRDQVVQAIADDLYDFEEPIDLSEEDARLVAESVAENLFRRAYIALDTVAIDVGEK